MLGVPLAMVPLTAVPQRTALSHAFGGLAAGLVAVAEYYLHLNNSPEELTGFTTGALIAEVLLGFLTFTGSLMAAGKLQEWIPTRPITYKGQNAINFSLFGVALLCGVLLVWHPTWWLLFPVIVLLSLAFGVLLIIPIGGADMPTVIALLNSYAGLSAVAMGFVLKNNLLIAAGALDGSSGLILSIIMCKAMNRSFTNVLFGAFGQVQAASGAVEQRTAKSATAEDAAQIMDAARTVVIIPGYGMAVAQAQHRVRELYDALTKRGVTVKFAIHPVAGRMPGHMNVLLAEAEIPYDKPHRDGRDQSRDAGGRRVAGGGGQRRGESGRPARQVEPHLRHADHRRRQGQDGVRHQAEHESRLCRHRERAVLCRQHAHALRRRQGGDDEPGAGAEGVSPVVLITLRRDAPIPSRQSAMSTDAFNTPTRR